MHTIRAKTHFHSRSCTAPETVLYYPPHPPRGEKGGGRVCKNYTTAYLRPVRISISIISQVGELGMMIFNDAP